LTVAILSLGIAVGSTTAQSEGERYYDETGHTVRGPFLVFFDSHGSLSVFGYPITDQFVENGRLVQYFQRARFEWHPENAQGFNVQLGLLGDELGFGQPRLRPDQVPAGPQCAYFAETGHAVCNAFLDYFRDRGGLDVFGYPISEYYVERDRIVQVFQRMRMEWHPEKPNTQKVQLTDIGTLAFERLDLDAGLRAARPPADKPYTVTRLNTKASVKLPVTGRAGQQTLYVVVSDQHSKAVSGVLVAVVVHLPSGDTSYTMPLTDERGRTSLNFPFGQTRVGEYIFIDVAITYQNLTTTTRASFLPWR
jgi:hypothetical protein